MLTDAERDAVERLNGYVTFIRKGWQMSIQDVDDIRTVLAALDRLTNDDLRERLEKLAKTWDTMLDSNRDPEFACDAYEAAREACARELQVELAEEP